MPNFRYPERTSVRVDDEGEGHVTIQRLPVGTGNPEPATIPDAMVHRDHASEMEKADK